MYRLVYTKLKEINEKFNTICVKDCNKKYDKKSIDLLKLSDRAWVSSGSSISIDGIILKGNCYIQERNITGNVFSLYKQFGDFVFAGTYIVDGNIFIKPIKLSGSRKLQSINRKNVQKQVSKTYFLNTYLSNELRKLLLLSLNFLNFEICFVYRDPFRRAQVDWSRWLLMGFLLF
jgi:P-type E1-E2 ATPase